MDALTLFHTGCGVASLLFGGAVVGMRKGTLPHRVAGWLYVVAMLLLCVTSFWIYELFESFGPFHACAIVSLVSIVGGMCAPLFRHWIGQAWLEVHYKFMLWSYVGLVMATGSHFFEPLVPFLKSTTPLGITGSVVATAVLCWGAPAAIGGVLIYRRKDVIFERVRAQRDPFREMA
jgi:uncharacterized membrane protein